MTPLLRGLQLLSVASLRAVAKHRQTGAALMRISFGSLTAILYALHLSQRHFLWGRDGVIAWPDNLTLLAQSRTWTLYQFFPSALGAECLYWIGLVIAVMFALGFFARITSVLFFLSTWWLYQRNWYAIDGGENLLIILSFYLMFADLRSLSLDNMLFPKRRELLARRLPGRSGLPGMLHNFAVVACLVQLSILYFESAFYKIQGHVWANGTALYYILRTNEFSLPGWSELIWRSAALVTLGTYATILFEVTHPFLMWHPRMKYLMFTGVVFLHTGIGIVMGLPWFSLTMISAHATLFSDSEYQKAMQWVRWRMRFFAPRSRSTGLSPEEWGSQPAIARE